MLSKPHATDFSRRGRRSHGFLLSDRNAPGTVSGGLRDVPGRPGSGPQESRGLRLRPRNDRFCPADPRAYRSFRIIAVPCHAWVPGANLHHRRHCRSAHRDVKDSAYIQEKEAEWQIRTRHRNHCRSRPDAAPLYTVMQAEACLRQIRSADYDEEILPHPSVRCVFRDAGHILGSAIIELGLTSGNRHRKLVLTGTGSWYFLAISASRVIPS